MPLTAIREFSVACRLGQDPVQVSNAREQAREALPGWGLGGHVHLAELIVSELVTNALRHGDAPIGMRLSYSGGDLRVEVHDGGAGRPVRQHAATDDECGRGLEVLDGLIAQHGGERGVINDHAGPGKTVYVAVRLVTSPGDDAGT
jgi:anti-sigma regulatory factor (Ser/Thr protein kinase)